MMSFALTACYAKQNVAILLDNASGNFVKVVQRIPVKIVLDNNENAAKLRAGMNVIVDVQVN